MKVYGVFTENEHLTDFTKNSVVELNSIKEARALFCRELTKNWPKKLKLFLFRNIDDPSPQYKIMFGRTGGIHFRKL